MKKSPELELQVVFSRNARRRQGRGGKASLRQSQVSMTFDYADDASRGLSSRSVRTPSSPNGGSDTRASLFKAVRLCWRVWRFWPPVRHLALPSRCRRVDRSQPARRPSRRPSGTSLVVTQTSRNAVINWRGFSVAQGNAVTFQNGSGATLNRVVGNVPSRLDGTITATAPSSSSIRPASPSAPQAVIATGGSFLASTLDVPDADFMKGGDLTFKGASTASVVNYGEIGSLGGDVALIARKVENAGTITAPNGTAALAAATRCW